MARRVPLGTDYVLTMQQVLFLCSGNYYRSRFAEILFNHFAEQSNLNWRAESRGIVAQWSRNPGPIAPEALRALAARKIVVPAPRYPIQLTEHDLTRAAHIIALYQDEHRPMMDAYFPQWTARTEFWNVPDLGEMDAATALALAERNVEMLAYDLLQSHERGKEATR